MSLLCGGYILCCLLLSLLLPLTQTQIPANKSTLEQANGSTAWSVIVGDFTPQNLCYPPTEAFLNWIISMKHVAESIPMNRGTFSDNETQPNELTSSNSVLENINDTWTSEIICTKLIIWLKTTVAILQQTYGETMDNFFWAKHRCLPRFAFEMERIGASQWCNWTLVIRPYSVLSGCTELVMESLGSYWPNEEGKRLLMSQHDRYFRNCTLPQVPLMHPPQETVLVLIITPICIIPIMVGLAVWYNRGSENKSEIGTRSS
ncbi:receptor activity-modifying protein 2 precursor [Callorhinchus milii]|uniref:Receptor activity-modifying protein 2 n=1 Tax=Callorhinchus milii TaxID=7868 RepID=K4FTM7_CALMI|nr:receptor activity-modifying protein 2 precursor [Callorhinchus milii]AFK10714.1 receptor activity-modifying protein 2 [Callorhinchus milii]